MKKFFHNYLVILICVSFFLCSLTGCSVREYRAGMPNVCTVDATAWYGSSDTYRIVFSYGEFEFREKVWTDSEIMVPDTVKIGRVESTDWLFFTEPTSYVRSGADIIYTESTPTMMFSDYGTIQTDWEISRVEPQLTAQTALVKVRFAAKGTQMDGFYVRVREACSGINLITRQPYEKPYVFTAPVTKLNCIFPLYRQKDYTQWADVYDANDKYQFSIDLGQILFDNNYDWTEDDLKSVALVVDVVGLPVSCEIITWEEMMEYDIVI